jgi:riboflavin transporter FmnP
MKQQINIEEITKSTRTFDVSEVMNFLSAHKIILWSWGAHKYTNYQDKALIFMVNGHHHKGRVYIVLNGADLFDIYLTSNQQNIKKTFTDIYIDELVELLDENIERIPEYSS